MVYLRADLLRAGDVVLLRSAGVRGQGRFSHAAIFAGFLRLFEARTTGVGFTDLSLVKVETQPNGFPAQLCDVGDFDDIAVYRLPDARLPPDFDDAGFRTTFRSALDAFDGLDYALLRDLAKATRFGRDIPKTAAALMQAIGHSALTDSGRQLPGRFCSELVVRVLQQTGFELLRKNRAAETLSPSDLADPTITYLQPQPQCLVEADVAIPDDPERRRLLGQFRAPAAPVSGSRLAKRMRLVQLFIDGQMESMASLLRQSDFQTLG